MINNIKYHLHKADWNEIDFTVGSSELIVTLPSVVNFANGEFAGLPNCRIADNFDRVIFEPGSSLLFCPSIISRIDALKLHWGPKK